MDPATVGKPPPKKLKQLYPQIETAENYSAYACNINEPPIKEEVRCIPYLYMYNYHHAFRSGPAMTAHGSLDPINKKS
jgi:hypothetical protein